MIDINLVPPKEQIYAGKRGAAACHSRIGERMMQEYRARSRIKRHGATNTTRRDPLTRRAEAVHADVSVVKLACQRERHSINGI
jgi:hypothetical protein